MYAKKVGMLTTIYSSYGLFCSKSLPYAAAGLGPQSCHLGFPLLALVKE